MSKDCPRTERIKLFIIVVYGRQILTSKVDPRSDRAYMITCMLVTQLPVLNDEN